MWAQQLSQRSNHRQGTSNMVWKLSSLVLLTSVRRQPAHTKVWFPTVVFLCLIVAFVFFFLVHFTHPSVPVHVRSLVSCLRSSECSWKGRRGGTRRPRRKPRSAGPCTPSHCRSLTTASTRTSCSMTTLRRRSRWDFVIGHDEHPPTSASEIWCNV